MVTTEGRDISNNESSVVTPTGLAHTEDVSNSLTNITATSEIVGVASTANYMEVPVDTVFLIPFYAAGMLVILY